MKQVKHILAVMLTLAIVSSAFALWAIPSAAAGPVATSTVDPSTLVGESGGTASAAPSYTANGISYTVPGADTKNDPWNWGAKIPNGATQFLPFSLNNNEAITIEFSVLFYDASGNELSASGNGGCVDIYIKNAANNEQLGMLRIWTNSGKFDNGDHSVELYGTDWAKQDCSYWVKGDATAGSSFTVRLDRNNFLSSYVGGQEGLVSLGSTEFIADRKAALENVDGIYFEIKGNGGFTTSTEVVLRSVNGQSLANTDGKFTDTVAPTFYYPATVATELTAWQAYTIPTEAFDVLGGVTYSVRIGDTTTAGKTFTPTAAGTLNVTLIATDGGGNTAEKEYTFTVQDAPMPVTFATLNKTDMNAQYAADGIRVQAGSLDSQIFFGTFDAAWGLDVKFIVPATTATGATNDAEHISFLLVNADNAQYRLMYRVWVAHSGSDCGTNVYITTDSGATWTDISGTGWISRTVDDVNDKYHMGFTTADTFLGDRAATEGSAGGMTRVDNAYNQLVSFLDACPSTRFNVGLQISKVGGTTGNYEMTVTDLCGQNFAEKIVWMNVQLEVPTTMPTEVTRGDALHVDVYVKDLRGGESATLRVTAPDGETTETAIGATGADMTFSAVGTYTVVVAATGKNGQEVTKTYTVLSKSEAAPLKFDGANLTLGGELTMNFVINKLTIQAAGIADTFHAIEIFEGSNVYQLTKEDATRYIFTVTGLTAADFGTNKTYGIRYTLKGATETYIVCEETISYSPVQYAINMYNLVKTDATQSAFIDLLLTLVQYADAATAGAKDTFATGTGYTWGEGLYGDYAAIVAKDEQNEFTYADVASNIATIGASLSNTIALQLHMLPDSGYSSVAVKIAGETLTVQATSDGFMVSGLYATDLYHEITFTFSGEGVDEVEATYSVARFLDSYTRDPAYAAYATLAQATAIYMNAAGAYGLVVNP